MKAYYSKDGIEIYHGDALEIMSNLPKVDAVLTDPPFGVRDEEWDSMTAQEFARFSMAWLSQAKRCGKELVTFCTQDSAIRNLCPMLWSKVRELIWYKPPGSQYAGASDRMLWYAFDPFLHCYEPESYSVVEAKDAEVGRIIRAARESLGMSRGAVDIAIRGKRTGLCYRWEEGACLPTPEQAANLKMVLKLNGEMDAALAAAYAGRDDTLTKARVEASKRAADKPDVFAHRTVINGSHPCEKPIGLICDILSSTLANAKTIVDPFGGSGTTAAAAKLMGRNCIVIEENERYCEVAANRLAQGVLDFAGGAA